MLVNQIVCEPLESGMDCDTVGRKGKCISELCVNPIENDSSVFSSLEGVQCS